MPAISGFQIKMIAANDEDPYRPPKSSQVAVTATTAPTWHCLVRRKLRASRSGSLPLDSSDTLSLSWSRAITSRHRNMGLSSSNKPSSQACV